jgi:hypothetical protein
MLATVSDAATAFTTRTTGLHRLAGECPVPRRTAAEAPSAESSNDEDVNVADEYLTTEGPDPSARRQ